MRSRAAYKLAEIARRDRLLAPGMTVVDLGAAPGGWSQVAAGEVGPGGRVIALDLIEMPAIAGVRFIRGDFRDAEVVSALELMLAGQRVDLVLSDMSPNLSGVAVSDQARALELAELARDFSLKYLKPRGNLLVKMFQGAGFENYFSALRAHFDKVAARKPEASRDRSNEVYLVAKGLKESRIERRSNGQAEHAGQLRGTPGRRPGGRNEELA
jgi:23S rRNA (uridine2552-2'-O)-methyltransferase